MENNLISFNSIKSLCFSKKFKTFHIVLAVCLALLNATLVRGLFSEGSEYMNSDGIYTIIILTLLMVVLVFLAIMIPYVLKKDVEADEDNLKTGTGNKILSIWFASVLYVIAQTGLFLVCDVLSNEFNRSFVDQLLVSFTLCVIVFVWVMICSCIYILAQSVRWYFIGFITLNFAPIIIAQGCYDVYNCNPLVNHANYNPLTFNLFVMSGAALINSIVMLLVVAVIAVVIAILKHKVKKLFHINFDKVSVVYKSVIVFLVSLACGFLISHLGNSSVKITLGFVLSFVIVSLIAAVVFTYLSFRNNKPILHTCINAGTVVVSAALILTLIPARTQKAAYTLPDTQDIESVEIFLDSIETFEIDKHVDECLELHGDLLELFKDHLPDEVDEPYVEPKCVAEMWDNVRITYKLKNGKWFNREYGYLNDPAFDEFYIKLLQSDLYAFSLQNTQMKKPSMRYYGNTNGYCELPESSVKELLSTYCEELQNADTSAFYEDYETIRFNDIDPDEYTDRIIYIPYSFIKTRDLAKTYIDMYSIK